MIIRLAELPIMGDWNVCMQRALDAQRIPPLPDVLILPELFTIGFQLDAIPAAAITKESLSRLPLAGGALETGVWTVAGTFPVRTLKGIVNMLPVFSSGGVLTHTTEKAHLFRNMGEHLAFVPGSPGGVFSLMDFTAGAAVCYDLRFPELFRRQAIEGAVIHIVPAQWPHARTGLFRSFLRARAGEAQVFAAGCNLGGEHLGEKFLGGGGVASPRGDMLQGRDVAPHVRDYELNMDETAQVRKNISCLDDRRPEIYGGST